MAKPPETVIDAKQIKSYLEGNSDFRFEVSVLHLLTGIGLDCDHAGTYLDPNTSKTRQFDIHARGRNKCYERAGSRFLLAAECKNLRPSRPLVVHCLPRRASESFQDAIHSTVMPSSAISPVPVRRGERARLEGVACMYETEMPVGKRMDQLPEEKQAVVSRGDREIFDSLAQAMNSAYALLREAHFAGSAESVEISVVIPVLVVPEGRLWMVEYDRAGAVLEEPRETERVSFFIDKTWSVRGGGLEAASEYTLSHAEICTPTGLEGLVIALGNDPRLSWINIAEARLRRLQAEVDARRNAPR